MPSKVRQRSDKQVPGKGIDLSKEIARPQLVALLFCDWANLTIDGKFNLIGAFDRISILEGGKRTPVFSVFIRVAHAVEEPIQLRVFGPDNTLGLEATAQSSEKH